MEEGVCVYVGWGWREGKGSERMKWDRNAHIPINMYMYMHTYMHVLIDFQKHKRIVHIWALS